jgi:transposase
VAGRGRQKKDAAALAGVSRPTVDAWLSRYAADGIAELVDRPRETGREQMSPSVRARILALTQASSPAETGLSHWSSREMAKFIQRTEGVYVSHHYVARLWRENGLRPHRQGTFKVSKDPAFTEKVADVVGLYLDPPGGAIVLSIDEKTQALDRTQPMLPIVFDASEKRTHDYVRHGTTNLFAALNMGTGEVFGECRPTRDRKNFLAFLKKAVQPHAGKEIHVVLDNLSTPHHTRDHGLAGEKPSCLLSLHPSRFIRGSTRSKLGSASTPASPSAAGHSPASKS